MQLTVRQPSASEDAKHYTTDRLRSEYLIETVFAPDDAILTYSHFDRIIAGGVMPVTKSVELVGCKELASDTFLQRREMDVINIGGNTVIKPKTEHNPNTGAEVPSVLPAIAVLAGIAVLLGKRK